MSPDFSLMVSISFIKPYVLEDSLDFFFLFFNFRPSLISFILSPGFIISTGSDFLSHCEHCSAIFCLQDTLAS